MPILRAGERDQPHLYYIRGGKLPEKNLLSEEGATEARQLNIPGSTTYTMASVLHTVSFSLVGHALGNVINH